ncbi:MAG: hypothetical protein RR602_09320 [Longicatena sp.]|uniref:hypothetical protein n=1 Tax=Anaerorhabdus sp. TaxID=1872524 RepID=UPI002FC6431F
MANKKVILREKEKIDVLQFQINDKELDININSTDQKYLRDFFYEVISALLKEEFEFDLEIEAGYNKKLFIDIAEEYIKQLNIEIKKIRCNLPELQ